MLDWKNLRVHLLIAFCALTAAGCSADADGAFPGCPPGSASCEPDGGGGGVPRADAQWPEHDDAAVDAARNRNPLCGLVGCFPGNLSACGPPANPEAGPYGGLPFDAGGDAQENSDQGATLGLADAGAMPDSPPASSASDASLRDASGASLRDASDASLSDAGDLPDRSALLDAATAVDSSLVTWLDGGDARSSPGDASAWSDAALADAGATDVADPPETSDGRAGRPNDAASSEPVTPKSCQIKPAAAGVVTACEPSGTQSEGGECNDSAECDASQACVDVNHAGVCRPLRCALPISCPPGTFYREMPLRAGGVARADVLVPVCLPDDQCVVLAAINPCTPGEVCAIVGAEGETSCVVPGNAGVGDPCDDANRCASSLVCTKHKNICVKLCHVDRGNEECMQGACEGGNNSLPANIGICVGEVSATP